MTNSRMRLPLAAVFLSAFIFGSGSGRNAVSGEMPDPVVGVVTATPRDVVITEELNGRVTPFLIAEVRPQVDGIILERLFNEGSDVAANQQLYQIDPAMYEATLASGQAQLARALANVDVAEAKLARYKRLIKANAVNQQEYDEVEAASKQARAEVGIADAQVRVSQINLGYARVLSPISGRIGKSAVTRGALVNANQPTPLAVVQQLDPIYVDVAQPVSSLATLRGAGGAAALRNTGESHAAMRLVLDGGADYPGTGKVLFADVTVDQTTGSISLRAEFPNPDHILLPGMYVSARLDMGTIPGAITIPQRALMRNPDGSAFVYAVAPGNTVEKRPVAAPRTVGGDWLISEGLAAGDTVIVDGVQRIRVMPGAPAPKVNPVPAE